jgi:hypothetical protein
MCTGSPGESERQVTNLHLDNNNMRGRVPEAMSLLKALRSAAPRELIDIRGFREL